MIRARLALCLLGALSGCNHMGMPIMKPVEVEIAIPIQCHQEVPPEPVWALTSTPPDANIAEQAKAALIEISQRQAYEQRLKAQILSCK